ncbi:MAG: hypothetical protein P8X79_20210 [Reinekea sp.]
MIGLEIPVSQLPVKEFLIGIGALASGSAKKHFRIMSNKNKVKKVYDHLRDLGKVRTIWQTDRPVNINNFYYRQELEFDGYQPKTISESPCLFGVPKIQIWKKLA